MKTRDKVVLGAAGVFTAGRLLKPRTNKFKKVREFMEYDFAYNGVYDNNIIPENSIPAYEEAVDNGYGIFTEAHLTKDNHFVLINEEHIKKLLGYDLNIEKLTLAQIKSYNLLNTTEKVPTIIELFGVVKGAVPIMVRLEPSIRTSPSTVMNALTESLDGYNGDILFDTSSTLLLHQRLKYRPDLLMGQVVERQRRNGEDVSPVQDFVQHNLLMNAYTSPDFISCKYSDRNITGLNVCRSIYGIPVFYWIIASQGQYEKVKYDNSGVIFKNIMP